MTITSEDLSRAHDCFTTHMKMSNTSWHGILEFSCYVGFDVLNIMKSAVSGDKGELSPFTERMIRQLDGPHAMTLLKAYAHRRYSWQGKLRAVWQLPTYFAGLLVCIALKVLRDFWRSW